MVPVVEFRGEEDGVAGDAGGREAGADGGFIAVGEGTMFREGWG